MEDDKYIQYVKIDGNDIIINARCSAFVTDPENWTAAGERTQRQWHPVLTNDNGAHLLKLVDGEIVERTTTARNADEKGKLKQKIILKIKSRANQIIIKKYPIWKQRNMLMQSVDLVDKKNNGGLTAGEQTEYDDLQIIKTWINNIRGQSDTLENDVLNLSLSQLKNYTVNFVE